MSDLYLLDGACLGTRKWLRRVPGNRPPLHLTATPMVLSFLNERYITSSHYHHNFQSSPMLNNPFASTVSISSNYLRDSAVSSVLSTRSMTELQLRKPPHLIGQTGSSKYPHVGYNLGHKMTYEQPEETYTISDFSHSHLMLKNPFLSAKPYQMPVKKHDSFKPSPTLARLQKWQKEMFLNRGKTQEIFIGKPQGEESLIRAMEGIQQDIRESDHRMKQEQEKRQRKDSSYRQVSFHEQSQVERREAKVQSTRQVEGYYDAGSKKNLQQNERQYDYNEQPSFSKRIQDRDDAASLIHNLNSAKEMKEQEEDEVRLRLTDSEVYQYPRRKDSTTPPLPPPPQRNPYQTESVPMKDTSRFGSSEQPQAIKLRGATYQMVDFD